MKCNILNLCWIYRKFCSEVLCHLPDFSFTKACKGSLQLKKKTWMSSNLTRTVVSVPVMKKKSFCWRFGNVWTEHFPDLSFFKYLNYHTFISDCPWALITFRYLLVVFPGSLSLQLHLVPWDCNHKIFNSLSDLKERKKYTWWSCPPNSMSYW